MISNDSLCKKTVDSFSPLYCLWSIYQSFKECLKLLFSIFAGTQLENICKTVVDTEWELEFTPVQQKRIELTAILRSSLHMIAFTDITRGVQLRRCGYASLIRATFHISRRTLLTDGASKGGFH